MLRSPVLAALLATAAILLGTAPSLAAETCPTGQPPADCLAQPVAP